MARESKFKQGMKVTSVLNDYKDFIVVGVGRNNLIVSPIENKELRFFYQKSLFKIVEDKQ